MAYGRLFEPFQMGPLKLKNRIVAAPSLPVLAHADGSPSRELIDYYKAKARGGAAIVTVGESPVDGDYAVSHLGQLNIGDDKMIPWLCNLADAIKQYGAVASLELCHGGRQTLPCLIGGRQPIGPSPISSKFHETLAGHPITVREMDQGMIETVKENFAAAAFRLKRAGFDMCLLHGGHGWLLAQFLSPFSNRRTDQYGGCLENRARFPMEVIERVRDRVGRDFAIEYRLSGGEQVPGGLTLEEAIGFSKMIEDKVDCIHVSTGLFGEPYTLPIIHPTNYLPHGANVHLAAEIKAAVKVPVTCVGAISDPRMMAAIIDEGKADLVAMTRALIADPGLPDKARRGRTHEIRPCTRCLECLGRVAGFLPVRCAVNPVAGRETACEAIRPAIARKSVFVAGGGPGGMQAAMTAAERGHRVVLFEKANRLGGNLRFADVPEFKQDLKRFRDFLIAQVQSLPVEIRLKTELTPAVVAAEAPDAVIVAVGAAPVLPDMPGRFLPSVVWAGDVHSKDVATGHNIVVAGGGMVGCETALLLAREGKKVVIVEMLGAVATDLNPVTRIHLLALLEEAGVRILLNHRLGEMTENGAGVVDAGGAALRIPADTLVLSLGMRSRTDIVKAFENSAPEVYAVGDCVRPGKASGAVHDAFNVASEL